MSLSPRSTRQFHPEGAVVSHEQGKPIQEAASRIPSNEPVSEENSLSQTISVNKSNEKPQIIQEKSSGEITLEVKESITENILAENVGAGETKLYEREFERKTLPVISPSLSGKPSPENMQLLEGGGGTPALSDASSSSSDEVINKTEQPNNKRKPETRRSCNVIPSQKCTKTMGSSLFPKPCIHHKPTLDQLRSYSFSAYIREVVLAKAMPRFEEMGDKEHYAEFDYSKKPMPLTEGIAKVSLPDGFCNEEGIGKDRTARGPAWQKGQPLGDLVLESPITQHIRGMAGIYEYTFTDNPPTSIAEFRDRADKYRESQVGVSFDDKTEAEKEQFDETEDRKEGMFEKDGEKAGGIERHGSKEDDYDSRIVQLDRHFWKRLGPTMPAAWYGADQEGTLFGDDSASGWSLGKLDSCLHVLSRVPGVTTPYLYAGMWASVFAAHTEDMNLLSINYLHAGAPKIWYAIAPGPDSRRFEALCEFQYSVAARDCKEFMRHKRYLLSPMVLQKAGIKYTTTIQRPGDAVITFPGAYHFGFNSGFNIAEATNFGVPEWIPYGLQARVCLCRPDSVRIDMSKLISLLELFESDRGRTGKFRLSWKEWSLRREQEKQRAKEKEKNKTSVTRASKAATTTGLMSKLKKQKLSEQEKKKEFWIEVVKPVPRTATPKLKAPKLAEEDAGRGKRKRRKTEKAAMWESEIKKEHAPVVVAEEIWHLAKPIGRKGVEVGARILCLLPGTVMLAVGGVTETDNEGVANCNEEEEEQCFAGTVTEIAEDHVRVHLAGLPKKDDVWVSLSGQKVFLDGGRYAEDEEKLPKLHYWKVMDSKCLSEDG